jgi:hypothetical protein
MCGLAGFGRFWGLTSGFWAVFEEKSCKCMVGKVIGAQKCSGVWLNKTKAEASLRNDKQKTRNGIAKLGQKVVAIS